MIAFEGSLLKYQQNRGGCSNDQYNRHKRYNQLKRLTEADMPTKILLTFSTDLGRIGCLQMNAGITITSQGSEILVEIQQAKQMPQGVLNLLRYTHRTSKFGIFTPCWTTAWTQEVKHQK